VKRTDWLLAAQQFSGGVAVLCWAWLVWRGWNPHLVATALGVFGGLNLAAALVIVITRDRR